MFEIIKTSSNPKAMLEMMANSNPDLKNVMQTLSSTNVSPKDLFYKTAREKGMSDQEIEQFLASMKAVM